MKKKGFTLIELLAVIVILAVIALIATPIILGVINKAEQSAFKNSVYGVYDAIDYYYTTNLDQTGLAKEFDFSESVPLNYKGEKMVSGKITIDEKGNKIVSFVTNGKYCANGVNNDIKVSNDCILLDETASEIDKSKIRTTSTTNSITVILGEGFAVDNESGIKDYEYIIKKDDKEINRFKTTDKTYTFNNLTHNTDYEITIKVTNNNNKVNEVTEDASTLKIAKPTIAYTNTPDTLQNGYLKKQVATITYVNENVTNPIYYIKTTREGIGSISGTPCGTETNPGECGGTATTSYVADTWYKVSGNVSITYDKQSDTTGTIYAAVTDDSGMLSDTLTATIDKIDTSSPNLELNTAVKTTNGITIPIIASDNHSGLGEITCKYSTTSESYTTSSNSVNETSCSLTGLDENKTYYYQVCIKDKVGNEATCKTGSATTKVTLSQPSFAVYSNNPTTAVNGYYKTRQVKVTYTKPLSITGSANYYIKSTVAATSDTTLTYICGNGTDPGTCTSTSTTSMAAGYWYYQTTSTTPIITETSNGTLYAKIKYSESESLNGTYTEGNIDSTGPSKPTITLYAGSGGSATSVYTSGSWTTSDIMTRSQSTDSQSGIQKYQYSHDGTNWSEGYTSWSHAYYNNNTMLDYWITWEGQWNFYIRAIDNLGNVGPASDMFTLRIVKCTSKTVSSYGEWGSCSKACGTGTQLRTIYYKSTIYPSYSCGTGTGTQSCNTQDCCSKTVLTSNKGYIDLSFSSLSSLVSDIKNTSSSNTYVYTLTAYTSLANLKNNSGTVVEFDTENSRDFYSYYVSSFKWTDNELTAIRHGTHCIISYYDGKVCSAVDTGNLGRKTLVDFGTGDAATTKAVQAQNIIATVKASSTNGYPVFMWTSRGTQTNITNSSGTPLSGFPNGTWSLCYLKYGTR